MLKTVIVEDEPLALGMMKRYISEHPKYELIGAYSDPFEALENIPSLQAEVLFVDIGMPGLSGLQLAERVKSESMQIVFTTAYSEYAVDAFRVDAVDYLVKPITSKMIDSIAHKLEKIKRLLTLQNAQSDRPDMKVQCFGSFKTTNQEGEIVKWPTRKTEEMFAFFLVKEAQIVSKWIIADELWPDLDGKRAIHNVYNTVYRLKKTIEEFSLPLAIKVMNEGYILERDGEMDVDLYKFRSMLSQTDLTMDELEQMNNLYIGPLFNDKDYAWSIHLKESIEVLYMKNSKYKK